MPPTEAPKPIRHFAVQMLAPNGWAPVLRICADTVCNSELSLSARRASEATEQMTFKRKGEVVARVATQHVTAWWIEEKAP